MNRITYEYVQQNKVAIDALVERARGANAVACEAPTSHGLRVRLQNEGFDPLAFDDGDGHTITLSDYYVSNAVDPEGNLIRDGEVMVVRGNKAYQVLDRHIAKPAAEVTDA